VAGLVEARRRRAHVPAWNAGASQSRSPGHPAAKAINVTAAITRLRHFIRCALRLPNGSPQPPRPSHVFHAHSEPLAAAVRLEAVVRTPFTLNVMAPPVSSKQKAMVLPGAFRHRFRTAAQSKRSFSSASETGSVVSVDLDRTQEPVLCETTNQESRPRGSAGRAPQINPSGFAERLAPHAGAMNAISSWSAAQA